MSIVYRLKTYPELESAMTDAEILGVTEMLIDRATGDKDEQSRIAMASFTRWLAVQPDKEVAMARVREILKRQEAEGR